MGGRIDGEGNGGSGGGGGGWEEGVKVRGVKDPPVIIVGGGRSRIIKQPEAEIRTSCAIHYAYCGECIYTGNWK